MKINLLGSQYHNAYTKLLSMAEKKWEDAIKSYKTALRNNASDQDAKYNLAYAQKMLEKEQQQQQQIELERRRAETAAAQAAKAEAAAAAAAAQAQAAAKCARERSRHLPSLRLRTSLMMRPVQHLG